MKKDRVSKTVRPKYVPYAMTRDIVKRIENELEYPGQIKVNVIREIRSIE